ncbi:MAG: bacterial Ig-like domain-containing protein, partial [Bacilli bacterium]|nr:bacterial Ig-like domain-containing protein [Bacilli bacterium]
ATSVTFTTTLSSEMYITSFGIKIGGNSGSAGTVNLKVDNTSVGNGNVVASSTTTINATDLTQSGTTLTIAITNISRAVLPYSISYSCQSSSGGNTKSLNSITLNTSNVQNEFYVNDVFDYSGLEVVAQYSDGTEETVEPTSVSTPDLTTSGTKTVNVSYAENGVTKESSYNISVLEKVVTGIYASTQKTYHPGEKILKEDIYAEDNFGNELDEFEFLFDEYVFTYADAASGGNNTIKTFEDAIVTDDFVCDLSVTVSRNNYQDSPEYDDVMTKSWTGASGTTYSNWSNKTLDSGVVYAGNSAAGNNSIQMRSDKSSSGIVITSNSNNLEITSVSISWNPSTTSGRKVDIYAKENAYSEPTDLYDSESQGTKVGSIVVGDADPLSLPEGTTFIGIRSSSGAVYLDNITIKYGGGDTAKNVSNYIMFEDENNQCLTKLDVATGYFENLSESEQEIFMNSTDYVISTARERLIAWAAHEGKAITTNSEGKYVISKLLKMNGYGQTELDNNSSTVILLVICTVGGGAVSILYLLKKKKKAQ